MVAAQRSAPGAVGQTGVGAPTSAGGHGLAVRVETAGLRSGIAGCRRHLGRAGPKRTPGAGLERWGQHQQGQDHNSGLHSTQGIGSKRHCKDSSQTGDDFDRTQLVGPVKTALPRGAWPDGTQLQGLKNSAGLGRPGRSFGRSSSLPALVHPSARARRSARAPSFTRALSCHGRRPLMAPGDQAAPDRIAAP